MITCLQAQELPGRDQPGDHHREAGEHGAGDEVGREDGGVPAGQTEMAKSKDTMVCTESTSGVERPASSR